MKKIRRSTSYSGLQVYSPILKFVNYLALILFAVIIVMPILVVINTSLKSNTEFMNSNVFSIPQNLLNFGNYIKFWKTANILLGFRNTLVLCIVSGFGSLLLTAMTAYAISRFKFKASKYVLLAFVVATMIPSVTTQVATFVIIRNLGLYNTIFSAIVLYLGVNVLYLYIFLQFMDKIPHEIDESAMIDGASNLRIFISIILPIMKPALLTVAILKLIEIYNDMFIPYLYMPSQNLRTVTTSLLNFSNGQISQWNLMSAGIFMVMTPTLIAFIFLQRYIIGGITAGALIE